MRIKQKLIVLFATLFVSQITLASSTNLSLISNDTIPDQTAVYKGNRIMVKGIKIKKQKGDNFKITYNLSNTGRNKIKLGKKRVIPEDLIVEFDQSLDKNELTSAKSAIIQSLFQQDISIRPGQLMMGNNLKFSYKEVPPSDRIVEIENVETEIEETTEVIVEVSEEITPIEKSIVEEQPVSTPSENLPEEIEETVLVQPSTSKKYNGRSVERIPPKESQEIKEDIVEEVKIEKEQQVIEEIKSEIVVEEEISSTVDEMISIEEEVVEVDEQIETVETIPNIESDEKEIESSNTTIVEVETQEEQEEIEEVKKCADLTISNVAIAKKGKRNVTISYTLTNTGNIPVALKGESKKDDDNIAIQVYFTRSEKLTRGSIPVKTFFIKKGGIGKNGLLHPNDSYSGKVKVETLKMTKFTPVAALAVNPDQILEECSRANNVSFVNVTEKAAPKSKNPIPVQPGLEVKEADVIGVNSIKE